MTALFDALPDDLLADIVVRSGATVAECARWRTVSRRFRTALSRIPFVSLTFGGEADDLAARMRRVIDQHARAAVRAVRFAVDGDVPPEALELLPPSVEQVVCARECELEVSPAVAAALAARCPHLTRLDARVSVTVAHAHLRCPFPFGRPLEGLKVVPTRFEHPDAAAIVEHWASVASYLSLDHFFLADAELAARAIASTRAPELTIDADTDGEDISGAVANNAHIRCVNLYVFRWSDAHARICDAPNVAELELYVASETLPPLSARAIAKTVSYVCLGGFDMQHATAVRDAFGGSRALRELNANADDFPNDGLGDAVAFPLCELIQSCPNMRIVRLMDMQFSVAGASHVAGSARIAGVAELDLSHNPLGPHGVTRVMMILTTRDVHRFPPVVLPDPPSIRRVSLCYCDATPEAVEECVRMGRERGVMVEIDTEAP